MKSLRSSSSVSAWWKSSTCRPPSPTNSGRSSPPWSTTPSAASSRDCSCRTAASAFPRILVRPAPSSGSASTSAIWWKLGLSARRESILVCLTNLLTRCPPMPPKLNRRRAELVLNKIDAILAWEARHENERDTRFVDLGKYLCEVRAGQYWRLENLKSFDEFLERRFPESRRKAYYLMSIHEHLPGWKMFVNRHQVVRFSSGLRKPALQELIKRLQVLQPPVLGRPHLTEVLAQVHKPGITLVLMPCLPGQDRVDLVQHQLGAAAIELGRHGRTPSKQVRQTDQDRLPACG